MRSPLGGAQGADLESGVRSTLAWRKDDTWFENPQRSAQQVLAKHGGHTWSDVRSKPWHDA
eukprot:313959-Alexandrium_andersonii.AAC.1